MAGAIVLALSAGSAPAADEHSSEPFHEEPPILGTLLIDRFEHRWRDGENSVD
jgi:copper resistance protein B